jgi:predicted CXXCH cytochrome family protein
MRGIAKQLGCVSSWCVLSKPETTEFIEIKGILIVSPIGPRLAQKEYGIRGYIANRSPRNREFAEGKQQKEQRMRRQHFTQLIGTLVVATALIALPTIAFAGIAGSAHDLSLGLGGGEICNICHTPHDADATVSDAPLWDHAVTATAAFTLYSSTTLDATVGQPSGVSKLCLSCHDGTVAVDAFGGAAGTTLIGAIGTGSGDFGTDLSNDHPISFTYNTALSGTDGELFDPSTDLSGLPGGGTIAADMLFSDQMECASCHDVHNAVPHDNLLLMDNAGSALCLTCHDK